MSPLQRALRGALNDWRLHVLGVFSVGVAFVCLAAALLVVVNMSNLRDRWASSGRASIYLTEEATKSEALEIKKALSTVDGVESVRFVSSAQARDQLTAKQADDVLAALPESAFPASLEVSTSFDVTTEKARAIVDRVSQLPAVESVETYESWAERLGRLLEGGVAIALLLTAIVLAAVGSVVASTIRLSLQRRSAEVEVLKVVGATDAYVRKPFVIEGAAQGAAGAFIALLMLGVIYVIAQGHFSVELGTLVGLSPSFLPWHIGAGMVAAGAAMGALAARLSLRGLLVR